MPDSAMTYTITDGSKPDSVVITLNGPAVLLNLFALQDELRTLHPQLAVFDLTGVPYMDSAGLGVLMSFYVSAEKSGHKMALAGVNTRIQALLDLTRVTPLLHLFPTVADAEAAS